ncbi:metalloregulator ArsR/SmtB family transcription factor [Saxibacter everestensis]|uniref:Metalloregulator ArsR/SmtB family transcription factor n=1 Tax=Saxibacter everestensis TaxID=2909229 RepID=A0ABY8QXZ0_9MICO|nr:metalloregulator ArsR/SmtB family transcription factor [Brevibacteriaceae bacterium ZFBP1038]
MSTDHPTEAQVAAAAATFHMLSSATRLRIVWLLVHAEYDVSGLAEAASASLQTVSQHLAKLRLAGLISSRRDGRHLYYTVDDPHVVTLVVEIFDHIAADGSIAPDPAPRTPRPIRESAETS